MADEAKTLPELSENGNKVLEIVEKMSVLELADLVKVMEDKFGVSAAAPVAVAAAPAEAAAPVEEKTMFNIVLKDAGANKIGVIKVGQARRRNVCNTCFCLPAGRGKAFCCCGLEAEFVDGAWSLLEYGVNNGIVFLKDEDFLLQLGIAFLEFLYLLCSKDFAVINFNSRVLLYPFAECGL